jgi:FdrA protein
MENRIDQLLHNDVIVINVGLRGFAESIQLQHADVIQVDWVPPAGGDREMIDLLDQLL